jgi:hypothetical protein
MCCRRQTTRSVPLGGNVYQVVNNRDTTRTQLFACDTLNRVLSGQSSGSGSLSWGENFSTDAWGHLYARSGIAGKATTEPLNCLAGTNNQLTTCSLGYDPPGKLTSNGSSAYT